MNERVTTMDKSLNMTYLGMNIDLCPLTKAEWFSKLTIDISETHQNKYKRSFLVLLAIFSLSVSILLILNLPNEIALEILTMLSGCAFITESLNYVVEEDSNKQIRENLIQITNNITFGRYNKPYSFELDSSKVLKDWLDCSVVDITPINKYIFRVVKYKIRKLIE